MSIRVTTVSSLVRTIIAERWKQSYYNRAKKTWNFGADKAGIYTELCALGADPDPEKVEAIIGNRSWTTICCSSCSLYATTGAVEVGYDSDSATVILCGNCLLHALNLACYYGLLSTERLQEMFNFPR